MTQPQDVQPDPAPTTPPVPGPPSVTPEPAKTDPPQAKSFTQDEVNRLFAEEKRRIQGKYSDYDDLKTKAAELDKLNDANASEMEKAVKAADAAARAEMTVKTNTRLVGAEIKAAAAHAGFNDPADAVIQLRDQIAAVKVGDDGDVDEAAVKALIDDLAKAKPYLVKTDPRPQPLPGQGLHQPSRNSGRDAGRAEASKRGFGKPPTQP